mgnify:CR=1 FL=1
MKKKFTISLSLIVLLIFIVNIFASTGIFTSEVKAIDFEQGSTSRGAEPGELLEGEPDPDSYSYDVLTASRWEALQVNGKYQIPAYGRFQIYCTHHGVAADVLDWDLRLAEALALDGKTYGPTTPPHAETPHEGEKSTTFYTIAGTSELLPWQAYVVSDEPINAYSDEKQEALWGIHNSLYQEAMEYADFDNKVRPANGLNPEDATNLDDVKTKVDQNSKEYTVGPFIMNYTEGEYGDIAFGGVHEMKIIGYNSEGTEVRDDIEIEQIIIEEEKQTPEYFEPDGTLKVDETEQIYPGDGEEFEIVFKDPNEGLAADDPNRIVAISIKVTFQYMLSHGERVDFEGWKYTITYDHEHIWLSTTEEWCTTKGIHPPDSKQPVMSVDAIRSIYEQELIVAEETPIDITMKLGGYVWEDVLEGKESLADGNLTDEDIKLKNVIVTLFDENEEQVRVVPLANDPDEDIMHHINSTLTDEEGYYQFNGLDAMKKYYVQFEYNGQIYLPTDYNKPEYNSEEWRKTSKATEETSERDGYDGNFQEIGPAPENYVSEDELGIGAGSNGKNQSYTLLDLMGYELTDSGTYTKSNTQLIDGYEYDELGLQTEEYTEGEISKKVREFIESNEAYPTDDELVGIYSEIAGGDEEMMKMLQFVEDCKIKAYTGNLVNGGEKDLYPYYDVFYVNSLPNETGRRAEYADEYSTEDKVVAGVTYKPIYPGQFFINLGLWRRQEFDAALRKDVYKAALKINSKTVVYNYNKRQVEEAGANNANGEDNNTYWDINVRMSDYGTYYGTGYNREIYPADYSYDSAALGHPGTDLEIYITYKITVRNQSMSILGEIKEVVDYYDQDYTYKPNLSWIMYQTSGNSNTSVDNDDYYSMMEQSQEVIDNESTSADRFIDNAKDVQASSRSAYGNEKRISSQYQNLYIAGLEGKQLESGETAYIYLTFEVNKDRNGRVILDGDSSPKENIAEINAYSTYYRDGTSLPNGVSKGSGDIAGLLDRDSTPGNFDSEDYNDKPYEKNFEDDTDRAPSLRVILDESAIRRVNGTTWEDERTETVGDAVIGDGIRQDDEIKISGVTVQLVEKCVDGTEYIWQETTTGADGRYEMEGYIPGDYVIRFYYGDTAATVVPSEQQQVSYNGQDFKSTTYQSSVNGEGIDQEGATDTLGRYQGYTHTDTQNVSGTYNPTNGRPTDDTFGYNIYKSDSDSTNYSDAKDIWTTDNRNGLTINGLIQSARLAQGRQDVINYSNVDVTNHKAEVLASPYQRPSYNGTAYTDEQMNALYEELMNETYMTAETGVIVVEFEYDRQQSDGLKETENNSSNSSKDYVDQDNRYNTNFTLNDIDLGLTERPKSQLEIDKSITNVQVTLANGSILFDINEAANNALWQDHDEYNIEEEMDDGMYEEYYGTDHRYAFRETIDNIVQRTDKGLIQLTMDQELMHGATIQITYNVKITNVGETDYVDDATKDFYYKGDTSGTHISTTLTDQVVDFVQNNLQFEAANQYNSEAGWQVISGTDLTGQGLMNSNLQNNLAQFNTIVQTESFNDTPLEPGDEVSRTIVLSQLITPENTEDDLTYDNMVEIVKTSNEVGRRMAFSVVGNQDPTSGSPAEVDANVAEKVVILPPFGEVRIYYIVGVLVAAILIVGIVLIKKKVLKK